MKVKMVIEQLRFKKHVIKTTSFLNHFYNYVYVLTQKI